jgi:hypothetical protein
MNIASRLAKLEAKGKGSVLVVWRHLGETNEQATTRWSAEHPGQDLESAREVIVIGWEDPQP